MNFDEYFSYFCWNMKISVRNIFAFLSIAGILLPLKILCRGAKSPVNAKKKNEVFENCFTFISSFCIYLYCLFFLIFEKKGAMRTKTSIPRSLT